MESETLFLEVSGRSENEGEEIVTCFEVLGLSKGRRRYDEVWKKKTTRISINDNSRKK